MDGIGCNPPIRINFMMDLLYLVLFITLTTSLLLLIFSVNKFITGVKKNNPDLWTQIEEKNNRESQLNNPRDQFIAKIIRIGSPFSRVHLYDVIPLVTLYFLIIHWSFSGKFGKKDVATKKHASQIKFLFLSTIVLVLVYFTFSIVAFINNPI